MAVVLLTGFEPFDGAARNPSADAVNTVVADYDGPHDLVVATLPVAFDASARRLRALIERHSLMSSSPPDSPVGARTSPSSASG